jgi:hypothetical protein
MAFAGAFARPPRSSHEVLQPETYIRGEKLAPVRIPDMREVLNDQYEVSDSGGIGEIDVRALMRQYGEKRRVADEVSSAWQGGAYVTFHRKDKVAAEATASTADLELLYISRWKTPQAAEQFAQFYADAVSDRYGSAKAQALPACAETKCPVSMAKIMTEEGPVIVEHWTDNSVLVTESFDPATAAKLGAALRDAAGAVHADDLLQEEIGMRLFEIPAFRAFARQIGDSMAEAVSRELRLQN